MAAIDTVARGRSFQLMVRSKEMSMSRSVIRMFKNNGDIAAYAVFLKFSSGAHAQPPESQQRLSTPHSRFSRNHEINQTNLIDKANHPAGHVITETIVFCASGSGDWGRFWSSVRAAANDGVRGLAT